MEGGFLSICKNNKILEKVAGGKLWSMSVEVFKKKLDRHLS